MKKFFSLFLSLLVMTLVGCTPVTSSSSSSVYTSSNRSSIMESTVTSDASTSGKEETSSNVEESATSSSKEAVSISKPADSTSSQLPSTSSHVQESLPSSQYDPIVYITDTGSKYHSYGCQYLRNSCIEKHLSDVIGSYEPCSKCNPPS